MVQSSIHDPVFCHCLELSLLGPQKSITTTRRFFEGPFDEIIFDENIQNQTFHQKPEDLISLVWMEKVLAQKIYDWLRLNNEELVKFGFVDNFFS